MEKWSGTGGRRKLGGGGRVHRKGAIQFDLTLVWTEKRRATRPATGEGKSQAQSQDGGTREARSRERCRFLSFKREGQNFANRFG